MRTFVMGDIHGAYKALMECLQRCAFDYAEDELIQLGDVADGSDRVYECVEELLKIRRLIAIKGNHDEWFHEFIRTGHHPQNWAGGAQATARSYLRMAGKEQVMRGSGNGVISALTPGDIPETHRRFFQEQLLHYIDERGRCFVHAGFDRHRPFLGQPQSIYYWDRDLWTDALFWEAYQKVRRGGEGFQMVTPFGEIFIGHTNSLNWDTDKPMRAANIHNIDTGAGHGGRLTVMDVETKEFWQSERVIRSLQSNA